MITRRYIVHGRVQGVGFRWFTSRIADAFDIVGFARNTDDGSVEIVAKGTPDNVRSFKEQIEIGPGGARVDRVTDDEYPDAHFSRFEVRH